MAYYSVRETNSAAVGVPAAPLLRLVTASRPQEAPAIGRLVAFHLFFRLALLPRLCRALILVTSGVL